jgi:hypothetical protein
VYVSTIRPTPATTSYQFAEGPATLLTVIGEHPRISKRDLAAKILGIVWPQKQAAPESPQPAEAEQVSSVTPASSAEESSTEAASPPAPPANTDPAEKTSPELDARKKQLAADLHYLVHAGHVIEFADGRLDLPLLPTQTAGKSSSTAENPEENLMGDEPLEASSEDSGQTRESEPQQESSPSTTEETRTDAVADASSGEKAE